MNPLLEQTDESPPPMWAILELMGHVKTGAKLSKDNQLGTGMIRADVPQFALSGLWAGEKSTVAVPENLEGWDTGTEIQIGAEESETAAKARIAVGSSPGGYSTMFYMSCGAEPIVEGKIYRVTASLKGVASDKPIKWVPRGYAERQSMNGATYPGQAIPVPVESNQALVGVTAFWISVGSIPNCDVTGTNVTPDFSPGVPENIWSSIPNAINVYPYGWVIESREPDIIPGTTVCFVKDQYVYYQHYKPGNS